MLIKEAKYCSEIDCGKDPGGNLNLWQLWYKKHILLLKLYFFFYWKRKKKKGRVKCGEKCFARTGPSVVISSKLSLLLQRPFNRSTEKAFCYTAQYLQQTNFLQVGHFAHKTRFLSPRGKFSFEYSVLLFYNGELNDDNNEAEHENIITGTSNGSFFSFPQCEHALFSV